MTEQEASAVRLASTTRLRRSLIELIQKQAVLFGDFVLKSGRKSHYYIDLRRVTLSYAGSSFISALIHYELEDHSLKVDGIAGPTLGADPIVAACLSDNIRQGYLVRSESKDHGTGQLIEGGSVQGKRLLVVEDVTTTGSSAIAAARKLEEAGGTVVAFLTVLDRLQGAVAAINALENPQGGWGYPFISLCTVLDLDLANPNPEKSHV